MAMKSTKKSDDNPFQVFYDTPPWRRDANVWDHTQVLSAVAERREHPDGTVSYHTITQPKYTFFTFIRDTIVSFLLWLGILKRKEMRNV